MGAFSDCCYSLFSSLLICLIARRKSLLGASVPCMPLEFSAVWKGQPQAGLQAARTQLRSSAWLSVFTFRLTTFLLC